MIIYDCSNNAVAASWVFWACSARVKGKQRSSLKDKLNLMKLNKLPPPFYFFAFIVSLFTLTDELSHVNIYFIVSLVELWKPDAN